MLRAKRVVTPMENSCGALFYYSFYTTCCTRGYQHVAPPGFNKYYADELMSRADD